MERSPSANPAPAVRGKAGNAPPKVATPATFLVILMMPLLIPATAFAHARMMSPVPRSNSDALKDPNGPCGVTRTAAQPVTNPPLVPGASLMVTWTETITHPGCYIVDFSASGDTGWTTLTTLAHRGTGPYNTMVTLPTTPCSACTLRVRQIMLGSEPAAGATCPPANLASGSTYYSCANVVLGAGGASGSGGASGTGGAGAGTGGRAGGTGGAAGRGTGGQSGTGGTVGTGGRANTGGTPATTGGAPGTGGMTTTSTGGAVGSGGAPVTTGTGGAPITGTGGAAPTGTGGAGTGIDDAEPPACACGITGSSSLSATAMLFGVLLGLAVRRGRGRARKPKAANQKP